MYRRALKTVAAAALITSIMGTSVFADDLTTLKSQQQEAQQKVDDLTQQLAYLLSEIDNLEQDYIDFYVKDTGIGISEEKLSHIFGRFVKLNSFVQGTGLGLAICQMIVEKMGGAITVESELHEGSTFRFTIPYDMYNKQEKFKKNAEREQHLKVAIKSLQLRTLLVAEDVDSNFLLMNTVLGKKYKLIRARDGREAVDMYKENHPDLIFMDIKMPYMDGLEATRLIRGYSKDIPIIALTAFAFESDREKAIEAGCNDYLTKPVSQEAIEKILDKYSL